MSVPDNIFKENEKHPMKIETRHVEFSNSPEVDASKVDFSNKEILEETINELKDMNIFSEHTK